VHISLVYLYTQGVDYHPCICVWNSQDASSCRLFFAKEPLVIGLFCRKWPMKIVHPLTLRHPVSHVYLYTSHIYLRRRLPNNDITQLSIDWWVYHSCDLRKRYCHCICVYSYTSDVSICGADRPNNDITRLSNRLMSMSLMWSKALLPLYLCVCVYIACLFAAPNAQIMTLRDYLIDWWVCPWCDRKRYCHCISVCVYILHVYLRRRPPEWWRYGQICRLMRISLI